MSHPNLDKLTGRDPNATFPVRTVAEVCSAHDNCHVISHWEQRDSDQPFTIAWHSHAHTSWHISCRLAELHTDLRGQHHGGWGHGRMVSAVCRLPRSVRVP